MKTYLLQEINNGLLHEISNRFIEGALKDYWLRNLSPSWIKCSIDKLSSYSHSEYIPVGSVDFVRKYMQINSISYTPIDYTHPVFFNTGIESGSLINIKETNKFPVFTKSKEIKKFSGLVLDDIEEYKELLEFYRLTENEPIFYNYTVRDYLSEWRMYIYKHKVHNVSHYRGDPLRMDEISTIAKIVESIKTMPIAYTLDIGYDRISKKWHPIEMNDFWGTGSYGCPEEVFYKGTVARWAEIIEVREKNDRNK